MIPFFVSVTLPCRHTRSGRESEAGGFGDRLHLLFLCVAAFEIGAAAADDDAEMKERG